MPGYKTIAEAAKVKLETRQARDQEDEEQSLSTGEFNKAGTSLLEIAENIRAGVETAQSNGVIDSTHEIVERSPDLLGDMAATANFLLGDDQEVLNDARPALVDRLGMYLEDFGTDGFMTISPANSEGEKKYDGLRRGWRDSIEVVLEFIKEEPVAAPKPPTFALYKIKSDGSGNMSFVEIPLP